MPTIELPPRLLEHLPRPSKIGTLTELTLLAYDEWLPTSSMPFFPEYTDHRVQHINEVLQTADLLIPDESLKHLSEKDISTLALATLFHDVALHIEIDGFRRLVSGATNHVSLPHFAEQGWNV